MERFAGFGATRVELGLDFPPLPFTSCHPSSRLDVCAGTYPVTHSFEGEEKILFKICFTLSALDARDCLQQRLCSSESEGR